MVHGSLRELFVSVDEDSYNFRTIQVGDTSGSHMPTSLFLPDFSHPNPSTKQVDTSSSFDCVE